MSSIGNDFSSAMKAWLWLSQANRLERCRFWATHTRADRPDVVPERSDFVATLQRLADFFAHYQARFSKAGVHSSGPEELSEEHLGACRIGLIADQAQRGLMSDFEGS